MKTLDDLIKKHGIYKFEERFMAKKPKNRFADIPRPDHLAGRTARKAGPKPIKGHQRKLIYSRQKAEPFDYDIKFHRRKMGVISMEPTGGFSVSVMPGFGSGNTKLKTIATLPSLEEAQRWATENLWDIFKLCDLKIIEVADANAT